MELATAMQEMEDTATWFSTKAQAIAYLQMLDSANELNLANAGFYEGISEGLARDSNRRNL